MALLPIALGAASLGASLLGRRPKAPKPQQLDISQELAMIGEMYNQARQQQETASARGLAGGLAQTSQALAGRGIYRGGVGEQALQATRKTYATALSDALAELSMQEAAKKAELSAAARQFNAGQLAQYQANKYQRQLANQAAFRTPLASMGANLLMSGLMPSANPVAKTMGTGDVGFSGGPQLDTNYNNYLSQALMAIRGIR